MADELFFWSNLDVITNWKYDKCAQCLFYSGACSSLGTVLNLLFLWLQRPHTNYPTGHDSYIPLQILIPSSCSGCLFTIMRALSLSNLSPMTIHPRYPVNTIICSTGSLHICNTDMAIWRIYILTLDLCAEHNTFWHKLTALWLSSSSSRTYPNLLSHKFSLLPYNYAHRILRSTAKKALKLDTLFFVQYYIMV